MKTAATLSFWFEFASPYAMLAALRLRYALRQMTSTNSRSTGSSSCQIPDIENIHLAYRPFMLGAVFKAVGQTMLPNAQVPVKGRYMFHDVRRTMDILGHRGFLGGKLQNWPPNSVLPGRMSWMLAQGNDYVKQLANNGNAFQQTPSSLTLEQTKVLAEFVWRVFEAEFILGLDIGKGEVVAKLWDEYVAGPSNRHGAGLPDGKSAVELTGLPCVKEGLKGNTQTAVDIGVFGAPTFTTEDGDLYWGNDRLVDATMHHNLRDKISHSAGFCLKQQQQQKRPNL